MKLSEEVRKIWEAGGDNVYENIEFLILSSDLSQHDRGYVYAKMEYADSIFSYEDEDWLYEVEDAIKNLE